MKFLSLGSPSDWIALPDAHHADRRHTGSAVYVFALIPLGDARVNSTPTFMNLTFEVDSHSAGTYQHPGTASEDGQFQSSTAVFSKTGLTEAPHTLTIEVGPDSVILLDRIIYTQETEDDGDGSNTVVSSGKTAPEAQQTGSGTGSPAPTDTPGGMNLCV